MTAPTLWNYDLDDACYRVRLMAALAGLTLRLRAVDAVPGDEPRRPEMMALNPLGRLPLFRSGDLLLRQTEAILLHIARTAPGGAAYLPEAEARRAEMEDWLLFAATELAVAGAARRVALFEGDQSALPALRQKAAAALTILEDHLAERRTRGVSFVAGETASVADIALFPAFALSHDYHLDHAPFPALRLWAREMRALDGFVTMPGIPAFH